MELIERIKKNRRLKNFTLWFFVPKHNPRPRLWTRIFLFPFIIKRGKGSLIRRRARVDIFPWHKCVIGSYATIEDFALIANGVGDLYIGDNVRIGIGSAVLGPVTIKSGCGLGQHVFVSGFNHEYADGTKNSKYQGLIRKPTVIDEDTHIGANSVVVAGVHIGKRCQIGAGSVVTKDIPDFSVAVGNPAKVIKRFDKEKQQWIKV